MNTFSRNGDATRHILGPDGRPYFEDAPSGLKLPPVWTFGGLTNSVSKTYSYRWDQAYKKSRENAIAMRNDCFLMGLLRERQLPTEQMRWHIEPEDKRDQLQIDECAFLEKVIRRMPYSHNYNRGMGEAIWYGRAGMQQALSRVDMYGDPIVIDGEPAVIISDHSPVNGDKIQFGWDGTPKVRIYPPAEDAIRKNGGNVQIDDIGPVLALDNPYWRSRFCIHRHDVVDADFYDINAAGQVGGIGIRGYIYWLNWLRLEVLSWMQDFMERTGLGLTIYYYDEANDNGLIKAQQAAAQDGRNTIICWPRSSQGKDVGAGIERIETSCEGMDALFKMVEQTFESKIERFIVGQTLSSGTEGSGLGGSGVADMHGDTKFRIIKSDCENQADTRTEQIVRVLQKLNPKTANSPYHYKWVYNVDDWDPLKKLQAAQIAYGLGVGFSEDELREPTGFSKPTEDDSIVKQFDPTEYHLLNAQARASGKGIPFPGLDQDKGYDKPNKPGGGKSANGEGPDKFSRSPELYSKHPHEGHWVTINGTHVFIGKDGKIEKGPPALVGKGHEEVDKEHSLRRFNEHHAQKDIEDLKQKSFQGKTVFAHEIQENLERLDTLSKTQLNSLALQLNLHGKSKGKYDTIARIRAEIEPKYKREIGEGDQASSEPVREIARNDGNKNSGYSPLGERGQKRLDEASTVADKIKEAAGADYHVFDNLSDEQNRLAGFSTNETLRKLEQNYLTIKREQEGGMPPSSERINQFMDSARSRISKHAEGLRKIGKHAEADWYEQVGYPLIEEARNDLHGSQSYSRYPEHYQQGHWVTIDGAHVHIGSKGQIDKGPKSLVGKSMPKGKLPSGKEVTFVPHERHKKKHHAHIVVDPSKIDQAFQKDKGFYIPPGGGGAEVPGRREGFERFLASGKPIESPMATLDEDGTVSFEDGRHRFSVLRDKGVDKMALSVPKEQAKAFQDKFGETRNVAE